MTPLDHPLYERSVELLGGAHVLASTEALAEYRRDKSPFPELEPAIVVRPGTVEEVQQVMRLANDAHVPVFARGNGFSSRDFRPFATPVSLPDARVVERRGRAQVALCYLRPHRRPALATRSLGDPPVGTRPFAGGASAWSG